MPQQAVVMPTAATGSRRRVERWSYIGMALAAILLSVAAFGPSIVSLAADSTRKFPRRSPRPREREAADVKAYGCTLGTSATRRFSGRVSLCELSCLARSSPKLMVRS